jgi:exodeoxyribonuclease-5
MSTDLVLFSEQQTALDKILEWYNSCKDTGSQFRLGGYAGTGKTTLIKAIIQAIESQDNDVIVCAFTGKAVSVLRKKGLQEAETLHHTMYEVDVSKKEPVFHLLDSIPADLVIVDEASMISKELYNDLMSFEIPVLWVGDPGQLEPVGDDIELMKSADFILNEIHRQETDSQILTFATDIRLTPVDPWEWRFKHPKQPELEVQKYYGYRQSKLLSAYDAVICGFNKTRVGLNRCIRTDLGRTEFLVPGDKVVCLKNSVKTGIFNGQVLEIVEVGDPQFQGKVLPVKLKDSLDRITKSRCWIPQFGAEKTLSPYDLKQAIKLVGVPYDTTIDLLDYGYVLTCHKSQGSEWDSVAVVEEIWHEKWNAKRWRYTAITRAAKKLLYLAR